MSLTIPTGGMSDGVVASGAFSADRTTLTLTLNTGAIVVIPVPALRTPTSRGVPWGKVTFGAKTDGTTAILVASEFGYTPASDTPVGMAKVGDTITLPVDPPSAETIGVWFVGSENGTDEVMSRLLLWGSIHRTANWNSEDIYFNDGKVIRVIMSRNTLTGALLLTFQQIDGAIAATQTIDIYPVVTSGGAGQKTTIITDDPASPTAPVAANEDKLLLRHSHLFSQSVHHSTKAIVTWASATAAAVTGYRGTVNAVSDLPLRTILGAVYFVRTGRHFVKATNTGGRFADYVPAKYIGSWTSNADANRNVTKIGEVAAFIADEGSNQTQMFVYVVTAYTPATSEIRTWERLDGDVLAGVLRSYFGFRVSTDAIRLLELVKASGAVDRIATLGVEVVYHDTRALYNLAPDDDGKLHIVTVV